MPKIKVFVDSSVIITSLLSAQGGGFYILQNLKNDFEFQTNEFGIREIMKALKLKFPDQLDLIGRLHLLLGNSQFITLPDISKKEINKTAKYISKNDAPILATALKFSEFLLTLDNEFFGKKIVELANQHSLVIIKPREFIELFRNK